MVPMKAPLLAPNEHTDDSEKTTRACLTAGAAGSGGGWELLDVRGRVSAATSSPTRPGRRSLRRSLRRPPRWPVGRPPSCDQPDPMEVGHWNASRDLPERYGPWPMGPSSDCWPTRRPSPTPWARSTGRWWWMPPSSARTGMPPRSKQRPGHWVRSAAETDRLHWTQPRRARDQGPPGLRWRWAAAWDAGYRRGTRAPSSAR